MHRLQARSEGTTDRHQDGSFSLGLYQSGADPNLYILPDGVLILLYVDDILVLYADEASGKAADIKNRLV